MIVSVRPLPTTYCWVRRIETVGTPPQLGMSHRNPREQSVAEQTCKPTQDETSAAIPALPKTSTEVIKLVVELMGERSYHKINDHEHLKAFNGSDRKGMCWHIRGETGWQCHEISVLDTGEVEIRNPANCPHLPNKDCRS